MSRRSLPTLARLGYTAWMGIWVPVYWLWNGPQNFLWLCDVANFVLLAAVWLESPLLFASQAVGVLVLQLLWCVDFFSALLLGLHPIGGTEYMFDPAKPLGVRALSLFHVGMPLFLLWALARLGFDRRGWRLQAGLTALLLPATWLLTDPERNVNWLWRPFGVPQTAMPTPLFVVVAVVGCALILYLPTHALLVRLFPPPRRRGA